MEVNSEAVLLAKALGDEFVSEKAKVNEITLHYLRGGKGCP
jgi:hypothetical protein